jgi:hypothetical protein
MPISGLIIDGSSLEQAVKVTIANTITPMTTVLFLFTPQNYPPSHPSHRRIWKNAVTN